MGPRSDAYLRGIPMKPYDLLKEGLIVLSAIAIVVVALAAVFGSPDYPTVRGEDVAKRQPIAFLKTSAGTLAGKSSIQSYGPPYTPDTAKSQRLFGIAPAAWFGVTVPLDPARDFVLRPLARVAVLNKDVAMALQIYEAATPEQQQAWLSSYLAALDKATVANGQVRIPDGAHGPVPALMDGMLALGRAGLLEGALESSARLPFTLDFTQSLLFFEGDVDHSVAKTLNMLAEQWGVSNETGPYPGAWWLWPYTFFYQIPPMATSPDHDLQVGAIMVVFFLLLLFAPFVPIVNQLPRWLGVYKVIWRDWYTSNTRSQTSR